MSNLWSFIKEKFFSKQFFSFVIIGFINTFINYVVLYGCLVVNIWRYVAVAIAFIVATIFSYFANSKFAFKNDDFCWKKAMETIAILSIRLLFVELLTELFVLVLANTNILLYVSKNMSDSIANLIASILLIPAAYLVLEKILKKKQDETKDDPIETDID